VGTADGSAAATKPFSQTARQLDFRRLSAAGRPLDLRKRPGRPAEGNRVLPQATACGTRQDTEMYDFLLAIFFLEPNPGGGVLLRGHTRKRK
jgi:hypothetical protein